MVPLKSLGLVLTACVCAVATRQSLSNLHGDCEFTLDGSRYDLCPLFHDRGHDEGINIHVELISKVYLLYETSFGEPPSAQSGEEPEPQVSAGSVHRFMDENEVDSCFSVLRKHEPVLEASVCLHIPTTL